ncbi:MAG: phosphoribosyltransferase family protein [Planctomycetaceae bacterium]|nr:phosphoribosyltransferase family protein [Planctomycetaceae bacterium]
MVFFRRIRSRSYLAAQWLARGGLRLATLLADLVYPPGCPLCGADGSSQLCAGCRGGIGRGGNFRCGRCGQTLGPHLVSPESGRGCSSCQGNRWAFSAVERLGLYEGPLREACIRGKSVVAEPLVASLGEWFWECRGERLGGLGIGLVIPVPQHWSKRLLVDHNQAETLAGVLARRLRVPSDRHILAKARWTRDQSSLSASKRRANLRDSFRVRKNNRLDGVHVLLVDDVLTTGTTAHHAARVLKKAGAGRVTLAVLAVVPAVAGG